MPLHFTKSLAGLKDLSAWGWGRVGGAVREKMVLHIEVVVDDTVIWFRIKEFEAKMFSVHREADTLNRIFFKLKSF